MIYTHVLNRGPCGVRSPIDALGGMDLDLGGSRALAGLAGLAGLPDEGDLADAGEVGARRDPTDPTALTGHPGHTGRGQRGVGGDLARISGPTGPTRPSRDRQTLGGNAANNAASPQDSAGGEPGDRGKACKILASSERGPLDAAGKADGAARRSGRTPNG